MFPERLHVVALAIDITTQLLENLESFFTDAWPGTADASITPATRDRLEQIRSRAGRNQGRTGTAAIARGR